MTRNTKLSSLLPTTTRNTRICNPEISMKRIYLHANLCDEETEINARILLNLIKKSDASRKKLEEQQQDNGNCFHSFCPFCSNRHHDGLRCLLHDLPQKYNKYNARDDVHDVLHHHDPQKYKNNFFVVDYDDSCTHEKEVEENCAKRQQSSVYEDDAASSTYISFLPLKLCSGDHKPRRKKRKEEASSGEQEQQRQQQLEEYHPMVRTKRRRKKQHDKNATTFLSLSQHSQVSTTPKNQGHLYGFGEFVKENTSVDSNSHFSSIQWHDGPNPPTISTRPTSSPTAAALINKIIVDDDDFDHGPNQQRHTQHVLGGDIVKGTTAGDSNSDHFFSIQWHDIPNEYSH